MQEYLCNKPYVSRLHAKIVKADGKIYVENLSGTNFTFVNNQKITGKTELHIDDEIGLGGNETNGERQEGAAYFALRNI
jgi:pSer/pThr/pTyr-binding forkhead associated (FHA) protein